MKYFLLSLLIITINLSLYAQTKRFENNFEPNKPYSKNMGVGNSIDYRLSHFDNPTDDLNFWKKDQQFISKTTNVVDSIIIAGQQHYFMNQLPIGNGKQTYTYDNNGKIVLMLQSFWADTIWVNDARKTYTYDSKGNITMESSGVWLDTSWVSLNDYNTYNEDGLLVLRYSSCFKSGVYNVPPYIRTIVVDSCRRNTYTYDSNGNMILNLYEGHSSDSTWREQRRVTYTYDSDGNMTLMLYEMFRSPNSRTIYAYNSNGNITSKLYEMLRSDSTWENSARTTYTYDSNGNMLSKLDENWDYHFAWENSDKTTYAYNSNGDMTLMLHEFFWGLYSTWVNSDRTTYTYDSNGNMNSMLYELWGDSTWVYTRSTQHGVGSFSFQDALGNNYNFNGTKAEIFYKEVTDVDENDNNNLLHYTLTQNYPNPFNPTTVISYSLPQSGLVQLKIYDVLGREVVVLLNKEQPKGNHKVVFNATNLTSGVYFYNFKSGNYTETKKMILLQ